MSRFPFLKKLKFLDYLIIVLVILGVIILYRFLNPEEKWVEVEVFDDNVPVFLAYSLKKGDIEKNPTGKDIAEIQEIVIYDTPGSPTSNKDLRVKAKILANINSRNKEYEYKNKILKVGAPIELRFSNGLVSGTVSDIDSSELKQELLTKTVTIKLYTQWPWFADSIRVGDTNIDELGRKQAEVIEKETTPAEVTVETDSGQKILTTDPQKVDITLKVKLLVQKYGEEYVYKKNKRVVVGDVLPFIVGQTRVIDASIIAIE